MKINTAQVGETIRRYDWRKLPVAISGGVAVAVSVASAFGLSDERVMRVVGTVGGIVAGAAFFIQPERGTAPPDPSTPETDGEG